MYWAWFRSHSSWDTVSGVTDRRWASLWRSSWERPSMVLGRFMVGNCIQNKITILE